ncbi:substrate-binding domain-containing protein [Streptomyces himalayensis]|uniref:DeoR/GlpR family transcriptional regulator n=1 Tax=Streptomyces himalayensis subsp. himalayensis TaxID=2756131 RepID=A0A7W0DJE1_9ACTN|nr:substrate-binding domain-containing protein [Streptomyces himalayensis]MBA2946060.1 DeoR/GlpR family transcriptional regulator [Streptomyces himalayensis subsp. himalayensis]
MREPVELRRQRILAVVQSRGAVRVTDLAAELNVSVVTVRRDVEELARAGKLRRGHGVARSAVPVEESSAPDEPPADGDTVALVVPERHSYLFETLHGARPVLEEAGLRIALHIAPQVPGAERPLVERALAGGARGLLIAPRWRSAAAEEADYGWLSGLGVPTVLMERRPRRGSALHALDSVCSDHWYGIHLAVDHLVSLGHRRIVLAARNDSPTARAIRAAFADIAAGRPEIEDWAITLSSPDAVPELGGPGPYAAVGPANSSSSSMTSAGGGAASSGGTGASADGAHTQGAPAPDGGRTVPAHGSGTSPGEATASAAENTHVDLAGLLRERGATAALLHGDVDALMLVQHLMDSGVKVPQDCSVVAYDDVVAALGSTPLTAVAPPKAAIGRAAAELLLYRLTRPHAAGAEPARRIELLPELKVRGSALPIPVTADSRSGLSV